MARIHRESDFPLLPKVRFAEGGLTEGALLLEGGSLRGVYTAGVCDVLMEQGIHMQTVAGVSAGALNGLNVLSRQTGRFAHICIRHRHDSRYAGWKALLTDRGLIGFRFILKTAETIIPYDKSALEDKRRRFVAVSTDCKTGKPFYAEYGNCQPFFRAVKASASLAFASRMVKLGDKKLLDGGYSESFPLLWAEEQGYRKKVVVLTQDIASRKPPIKAKKRRWFGFFFRRYPAFLEAVERVPEKYNSLREHLQAQVDAGEAFVIFPSADTKIGKMEKDAQKLYAFYLQGRQDALDALPELREYLSK